MAATTVTSSAAASVVFGCTAETGILIQKFSREVNREKKEITDNDGDVVAVSYFKPTAKMSIEGMVNGSTGVAAAAPGVALSLNSTTSGNGITGGSVIVDSVSREEAADGFTSFKVAATQYPSL